VGFSRTAMSDESFRDTAGDAAKSISEVGPIDPKKWSEFAANLYYQEGEYGNAEDFKKLAQRLDNLSAEKKLGGNRLFLSFHAAGSLSAHRGAIGHAGLAKPSSPDAWVRIHYREAIWARLDVGKKH